MTFLFQVNVGDGKHWTAATVTINPRYVERNPVFYFRNSTYTTSTLENSTKVINLLSLDVVGAYMNEPLRFELLSPTKFFGVRPTSGVVYTTGEKLDREEQTEHMLLVQVSILFIRFDKSLLTFCFSVFEIEFALYKVCSCVTYCWYELSNI
jgi:hypothetical protein